MNQLEILNKIKEKPYTTDIFVFEEKVSKPKITKKLNKMSEFNWLYKLKIFFNHRLRTVYIHPDLNYWVSSYLVDGEHYLIYYKDILIKKLRVYLIDCYILLDNKWRYLDKKIRVNLDNIRWSEY